MFLLQFTVFVRRWALMVCLQRHLPKHLTQYFCPPSEPMAQGSMAMAGELWSVRPLQLKPQSCGES